MRRHALATLTLSLGMLLTAFAPVAEAASLDSAAIDRYVQEQMDSSHIPGIAVAVVEGESIIYARGFGDAGDSRNVTPQTPFPIGSLTKSMTALAVMQLVEAGRVALDAPVQTYIPWFQVADPDASARITVRHLLNQTSGISRATGIKPLVEQSDASLEETVRDLRTAKLNRPVGATYEYSNANFAALAYLVETVSGQTYGDYLDVHIFAPLGMTTATISLARARESGLTAVHRYWFGFPVETELSDLPGQEPAFASAEDMARYLAMYLNDGSYQGARVLSAEGIAQMLEPATNQATRSLQSTSFTFRYGMGWFAGPFGAAEDARWHQGELPPFNAWMVLLPETNRAVIVLNNAGSQLPLAGANSVMSRIPVGVVNLLDGQAPPEGTSLTRFYVIFDLIVVAIVAFQIVALVRLTRRPASPSGRPQTVREALARLRFSVPLLWELGLALLILLGLPAAIGASWRASFMSMPDFSLVLVVVSCLWLVTGIARVVVLARRARVRHAGRARAHAGAVRGDAAAYPIRRR